MEEYSRSIYLGHVKRQRREINRTLDDMSEDEAAELALQIVELWRDYKEAIPQGR